MAERLSVEPFTLSSVEREDRALPDEEQDRTLATRLELAYPSDEQAVQHASLARSLYSELEA